MSEPRRPSIQPGLLGGVTAQVPARLQKKLDADPQLAMRWTWTATAAGWTVDNGAGETVTLAPRGAALADPQEASCSCLLSPRCLHLLAVLSVLELAGPDAADGAEPGAAPGLAAASAPAVATAAVTTAAELAPLGPVQQAAVRSLVTAAATTLAAGAQAAGSVVQGELLRGVHACRTEGLHRLAAAGTRLLQGIRDGRADRARFSLAELSGALAEALEVGHRLQSAPPTLETLGVARREYRPAGNLQLTGLFSEALDLGVVTYLVDPQGRIFCAVETVHGGPGAPLAAPWRAAYEGPVRVGGLSLTHRALGRQGLFVQSATTSDDGRLGAGAEVRAVSSGPSAWTDAPVARRFAEPIDRQLERALAAVALPEAVRPAGSDLLFLQGEVLGHDGRALLLAAGVPGGEPLPLRALAPSSSEELPCRANLRLLSRAEGLPLALIGRPAGRPREILLLAVGDPPPAAAADTDGAVVPRLRLPSEWRGRCHLGLDALQGAHFETPHADPPVAEAGPPVELEEAGGEPEAGVDPLAPLRRRLERVALGGRATLTHTDLRELDREAARLERRLLPTGSRLLLQLASGVSRDDRLARAWLAGTLYLAAAGRALGRDRWLGHGPATE